MGEWAVYYNIKKKHVDIVDTSDARPRGLLVFGEADIDNTNGKTEKTQYNNTKFMVLDSWRGVLLAAPGVRIGGGPPAAGRRSPCSWLITECSNILEYNSLLYRLGYSNLLECRIMGLYSNVLACCIHRSIVIACCIARSVVTW